MTTLCSVGFTWFQFNAPPYADSGRGHSAVSVPITSSIAQLHKSYGTWHVFTAYPTTAAVCQDRGHHIEWRDTELLPIIVIDQSCSSVRQLFSPCCAGADMLAPATKRRVFCLLLLLLLPLLKSITHQLWSRLRSLRKSCFQEAYLFLLKRPRRMKLYCRIMGFVSHFITHWQSLLLLCGTKPTILLSKHVPLCAVTAWFTTHSSSPRSPDHPYQS